MEITKSHIIMETHFIIFYDLGCNIKAMVNWNKTLKSVNLENHYQGPTRLRENGKIKSRSAILGGEIKQSFADEIVNGFYPTVVHLGMDYLAAFKCQAQGEKSINADIKMVHGS